jgi:hypothetical protein
MAVCVVRKFQNGNSIRTAKSGGLAAFYMNLQQIAEAKCGKERAEELRFEIRQLASEIERLRTEELDIDDEP